MVYTPIHYKNYVKMFKGCIETIRLRYVVSQTKIVFELVIKLEID